MRKHKIAQLENLISQLEHRSLSKMRAGKSISIKFEKNDPEEALLHEKMKQPKDDKELSIKGDGVEARREMMRVK